LAGRGYRETAFRVRFFQTSFNHPLGGCLASRLVFSIYRETLSARFRAPLINKEK
jgi:hypothetical protein